MSVEQFSVLALAGAGSCWVLTALVRHFAIHARMLDQPNERSSHTHPTPRGGGAGIVASFLAVLPALGTWGMAAPALTLSLTSAGVAVAVLGFVDDRRHVPARWRFLGHGAAAGWVVWCLGTLPPVPVLGAMIDLGFVGMALSGVFIVWSINLFNFMDGIDGIASIEAITVSLGGAFVTWLVQPTGDWAVAVLFAACVAGFLIWNFPPAKIFMGDAGSGFLGLVVATLSLWCARDAPMLLWSWLILTAAFMTDATVTLIRRVLRGEKFYLAHRSHAYQYASRLYKSHKVVTLAFGAINVFWLFPWALAVALGWIDGVLALLIAYAPLVLLAFHYKAGDRAAQGDLA